MQQDGEITALHPAQGWPIWMTDRLFFQTLSFDALEVLDLVEDAGATPSEVDAALGQTRDHAGLKAVHFNNLPAHTTDAQPETVYEGNCG